MVINPDFGNWLLEELGNKNMSQAQLARKTGLSTATVSRIINGNRGAGPETCAKIAIALDLPLDVVLIKAGLITTISDKRVIAEHITLYKLAELSADQLDEVLWYIEAMQERDEKRKVQYKQKRKREGAAPPEAVKE